MRIWCGDPENPPITHHPKCPGPDPGPRVFAITVACGDSVVRFFDQRGENLPLHACERAGLQVVVDPCFVGDRRHSLDHARNHTSKLLDLPLRSRIDTEREEVEQVM